MNITEITMIITLSLVWLWVSNAVSIEVVSMLTPNGWYWITVERGWIEKLYKPKNRATKAETRAYYRRINK